MLKRFFRLLALSCLCLLFVYAPEILVSVSAPYSTNPPRRVLLRISLCTQDQQTVSSLYSALSGYQKNHAGVHLRVLRCDARQILEASSPLPDLCLVSEALYLDLSSRLQAAYRYLPSSGEPLLLCLYHDAEETGAVRSLAAFLCESDAADNHQTNFNLSKCPY